MFIFACCALCGSSASSLDRVDDEPKSVSLKEARPKDYVLSFETIWLMAEVCVLIVTALPCEAYQRCRLCSVSELPSRWFWGDKPSP